MIDTPEDTVKLKDEDVKKIELVQNRLSNLQAEVLYATKRLATITEEENKAREAREYAESERVRIEQEVSDLRTQKDTLESALKESTRLLESHQNEHTKMHAEHRTKTSEADKRIADAEEAESALAIKAENMVSREKALDEKRSEVENAQQTILRALESVTWK